MSFIHTCSRCGRKSVPGETGWILGPGTTCPECREKAQNCILEGCGKHGTVTIRICADHATSIINGRSLGVIHRKKLAAITPDDEPPPDAA